MLLLLTEQRYLAPANPTPYAQNVLLEDRLVKEALEQLGYSVGRVDWADPTVDWASCEAAIFRTTWDYFDRFAEFSEWMDRASAHTRFLNPVETIRWNMDKHYLPELEERGIHLPPTLVLETGDPRSLAGLLAETGWKEAIIKPCVSGGAKNTFRINSTNVAGLEDSYRTLIAQEAFLVQPLLTNILTEGELSLMVIGGEVTHAVRKVAKSGDFRVQDDWGGTVLPHTPTAEEMNVARMAVEAVWPRPAYARVDLVRDNQGQLALMELELIEPEMWFRKRPAAAVALAKEVQRQLRQD